MAAVGNKAQILKLDLHFLIEEGIKPLGVYPFMRPFTQKFFLLRLHEDDDLLTFKNVVIEQFVVIKELAKKIGLIDKFLPNQFYVEQMRRLGYTMHAEKAKTLNKNFSF